MIRTEHLIGQWGFYYQTESQFAISQVVLSSGPYRPHELRLRIGDWGFFRDADTVRLSQPSPTLSVLGLVLPV